MASLKTFPLPGLKKEDLQGAVHRRHNIEIYMVIRLYISNINSSYAPALGGLPFLDLAMEMF